MEKQPANPPPFSEKALEINRKIDFAQDFNGALRIAAEEIGKTLEVDRIQIILHRPDQEI